MKLTDAIQLVLDKKERGGAVSVTPDQLVYEALQKMAEYGIGAVLVLANDRLVGILSERDYARKGILTGHLSKETKVHEIMSSPVVYVGPEQTVDECMAMMTNHRVRHLPVLQGGSVVGVISIGDLVKWIIAGQEQAIQELEGYITGAYPR